MKYKQLSFVQKIYHTNISYKINLYYTSLIIFITIDKCYLLYEYLFSIKTTVQCLFSVRVLFSSKQWRTLTAFLTLGCNETCLWSLFSLQTIDIHPNVSSALLHYLRWFMISVNVLVCYNGYYFQWDLATDNDPNYGKMPCRPLRKEQV